MRAIYFVALIKKVKVKANSKPLFDLEIILVIEKRDKLYSAYKRSGLEKDKCKFKTSNYFFKRCYAKKKLLFTRKVS